MALTDDEKYLWLAWEERRMEKLITVRESLVQGRDGKSQLTPEAYTLLAIEGMM